MRAILEQGGTPDFMDAFIQFRGRPPKIDALLYYSGLNDLPQISEDGKMVAPNIFKRKASDEVDREDIKRARVDVDVKASAKL